VQGFLNLNKPAGFTSHDCVAKVRRSLQMKRVGHGGTLDPAATGVLPIALGRATRLLQYLRQDKAYRATVRLGMATTTDDLEGETILTQPVPDLSLETVREALQAFQGKIQQIPPNYSAIQVQGQRLYDRARRGESIAALPRSVEVFGLEVLEWRGGAFPEVELAIGCGPGTYIRSIARDLGTALHTGGVLTALSRTASCGLHLADSLNFADLEAQLAHGHFAPIPPAALLSHLRSVALSADKARRWCQGQRIIAEAEATVPDPLGEPAIVQVYNQDGQFLGIGQWVTAAEGILLVPQMVFQEG